MSYLASHFPNFITIIRIHYLPKDKLVDFKKLKPDYDKARDLIGEKLLESASEWAGRVPRDLSAYLQVIERLKKDLTRAPAHGDFVLRQIYPLDNNKLGLIDGEHAALFGPRYYDVAQFFLRTYLDHNTPDQAIQFLREFKELLTPNRQSTFWPQLKPVLIQRFLGDMWGAKSNPTKLDQLEILGQKILSDQIIT